MSSHRGLLHHLNICVLDVQRSAPFYGSLFRYLGYELAGSHYADDYGYEDWRRYDLDTPHEISIIQADPKLAAIPHVRRAVGHHDHLAFCAEDRADVDRLYQEVLLPLVALGLCVIEDPPCDCPEYGEGYYATFFFDPDGLKYEFVINPNHLRQKFAREQAAIRAPAQSAAQSVP
jgi:catechol 2,3-dioxygenase-like lactoylglutathione lyase family enzyme